GRLTEFAGEGAPGSPVAAHTVNAAPRRRGRRAQVHALERRVVGPGGLAGAKEELEPRVRPTCDVAADEVWVVLLQSAGAHFGAHEDGVAETGREPFDLGFNATGDVLSCGGLQVRGREVSVGPERVLPRRRAGGI